MFSNNNQNLLSNLSKGRDNNFNLIRVIAALAVLVTHSFALVAGTGAVEPLRQTLGMTLGTMAVDVFFITSGFLVTGSLLARKSLAEFVAARVLRIYPALVVMVILSVFVLGVAFSTMTLANFLARGETYKYLFQNSTLLGGVVFALPGVFESVPYKSVVNASLWTLPTEVTMYASLAFLWLALFRFRENKQKRLEALIVLLSTISLVLFFLDHFIFHFKTNNRIELVYCFFVGSAFFVIKDRITLSAPIFFAAILLLFVALLNRELFFVSWFITLPYILFWVVFVPKGKIRSFNQLGDYSYGLYIYAFPVQQSLLTLFPSITVGELIFFSAGVTFIFAYLSWHFIEEKSLKLKTVSVIKLREAKAAVVSRFN